MGRSAASYFRRARVPHGPQRYLPAVAPCPSTPFSSLPHCRRHCSRPLLAMFSTQCSSAVLELSSSPSNYSSFALGSSVHCRPSPSSSPTSSAPFPSTVRYVLTQPFPFPWATFLAIILTIVPSRQLTTTSPLTLFVTNVSVCSTRSSMALPTFVLSIDCHRS